MEGGIAAEESVKYNKLLGEIPKTTYGNPLTVHHRLIVPFQDLDTVSKLISPITKAPKLYKSPPPAAPQENTWFYGSNHKISEVNDRQYSSILPDEDSLMQSFYNMSIKENTVIMPTSPPSRNLNGITSPNVDLKPQSSFMRRNRFVDPSDGIDCLHNSKLFKPDCYEPNSYQPNLYMDAHSPFRHITQPGMLWHGIPSYSPEVLQLENGMNLCMGPLNYCQFQPQGPSGRVENYSSLHGPQPSSTNSSTLSVADFEGRQILDEVVRKSFPGKILARSNGTNAVRIFRPNPCYLSNGFMPLDNQKCGYSPPADFDPRLDLQSVQINYNSVDDDVTGRVYLMSKTQHGCRFLQRKFALSSREDISNIFLEIICHIAELMIHPIGNYFVQKLLELCNEEQITLILKAITPTTGELFRISCDLHGTRSVQKLIETLKTPEHASMVLSSLEPDIVSLMKNINGNHGAQRCFQYLSKHNKYLMDAVISHCIELAKDRQGCCVLQTCLTYSDGEQKQKLMNVISSSSLLLSKDPYGNYVIQFVLELNDPCTTASVLNQLKGNYEHLSTQKYSSNVVEKCIKIAGESNCATIIEELMTSPRLRQILQDKYGNYVMQSALSESKACRDLHFALAAAIRCHSSALRNSPYGKKVLSRASLSKMQGSEL